MPGTVSAKPARKHKKQQTVKKVSDSAEEESENVISLNKLFAEEEQTREKVKVRNK